MSGQEELVELGGGAGAVSVLDASSLVQGLTAAGDMAVDQGLPTMQSINATDGGLISGIKEGQGWILKQDQRFKLFILFL